MNRTDQPMPAACPGSATAPPPATLARRRRLLSSHHPCGPAATVQAERLRQAAAVLRQERAPGADYYPADDEIISAWAAAKHAGGGERGAWPVQLDRFLAAHLDCVRDLMLRARSGRAPARLLDELESAVAAELARRAG